MFTDEKKFNLDGTIGLKHYQNNTRINPKTFSRQRSSGGSFMIWRAISHCGPLNIYRIDGCMNSEQYIHLLQQYFLKQSIGEKWTFKQDKCSVHCSKYTKYWFEANDVDFLDWQVKEHNVNIVENVWGQLVRVVNTDGKQCENTSQLEAAIATSWPKVTIFYVTLYRSIPNVIIAVSERKRRIVCY